MSQIQARRVRAFLLLAILLPAAVAQTANPQEEPITGTQRLKWFAQSTAGTSSLLLAGPFSAAWGTMLNAPVEYGPHWSGFGKRYALRLTGVATSNALEAGLGAFQGEDPRYFRSGDGRFVHRLKHAVVTTFTAPGRDGQYRPAWARFAAVGAGNVISNAWRPKSERDWKSTLTRHSTGFLGRMASNAFSEFWPDIKKKLLRRY